MSTAKDKNENKKKFLAYANEYIKNTPEAPSIKGLCYCAPYTEMTLYNYLKDEQFNFNDENFNAQLSIIIDDSLEYKNFSEVIRYIKKLGREITDEGKTTLIKLMRTSRHDIVRMNAAKDVIKLFGTNEERKRLSNFDLEIESIETKENKLIITLPDK